MKLENKFKINLKRILDEITQLLINVPAWYTKIVQHIWQVIDNKFKSIKYTPYLNSFFL